MTSFTLPVLFKRKNSDHILEWRIKVENKDTPTIITEFGQRNGKIQIVKELIKQGKNVGKSNSTTAWSQACSKAKSKWELQKKKKGYVETLEAALSGEVDVTVLGGIFPMLADKFEKQADKIEYPAFIQPKFDGHRCIAIVKDGVCTLWSRTRKPITSCPHICSSILRLVSGVDMILDGELYNHDYNNNFEQITKLIRPIEPVEGYEKVKYYIYDCPSFKKPFKERTEFIKNLFTSYSNFPELECVSTYIVENENDISIILKRLLLQGYEGAMLRTSENVYDGHPTRRSSGLLKIKKFDDAEFEIVGVHEGVGRFEGLAIFLCKTKNGLVFNVSMNCSRKQAQEYFQNSETLIGKQLTVQFQGYTSKNKVPRFPRAVRLREEV